MIESAGGNITNYELDGSSLWSLLKGEEWRTHLDLELGLGYNSSKNTLSWNGIFTKDFKYMYFPKEQKEMLFNMTADPNEYHDLVSQGLGQNEVI